MNEEQFLNIMSQMLLNAGYTKTRDALFEEAKAHGFKITKKEIPLAKDLEICEPMESTYKTGYGQRLVVKNTNTTGSNAYVVACECGGVMEDPDIHYEDYQLIRAESPKEAVEKYNKLNNCNYYYGKVVEWPQKLPWL